MKQTLTVAAIQMVSSSCLEKNLITAAKLVKQAAEKKATLVVLPEFFIRIADTRCIEFTNMIEELGSGTIQQQLSQIACDNKVYLVAGTIPIKATQNGKCYNTCLVYNPDGYLICNYHKIHLFKFDNQLLKFDESVTFENGQNVTTFKIGEFSFGLSVCYDLRFPELFREMAGVDAIILPAAFVHHTGIHHWEVLLRARAIENQCYVIASDQGGKHDNGRHTYGHSMIINPWGTVKEVITEGEGIIIYNLTKEEIQKIRNQLPALTHRKL